jgi:hypothetical protein
VTTGGPNNAVAVLINNSGQLGTVSSSRRHKEDIHEMGAASDGLLRLRPVTLRCKQLYVDGSKPVQYVPPGNYGSTTATFYLPSPLGLCYVPVG